jgi:hypothetical protein
MFAIHPGVDRALLANPIKRIEAPAPSPAAAADDKSKPVIDDSALSAARYGELKKRRSVQEAIRTSKDRRGVKHLECALSLLFSASALREGISRVGERKLALSFLAAQRKLPHGSPLDQKARFIVKELSKTVRPDPGFSLAEWARMLEKQMEFVGAERAGEIDPAKRDVRPWCAATDGPLPQ